MALKAGSLNKTSEESFMEIMAKLDPLPKRDGVTNFELLRYQVGPLMSFLETGINKKEVPVFWIDLFSGAGGTTSGIHLANDRNIRVIACVNHDEDAILSHKENHPSCIHLIEDVRDMNVVMALKKIVEQLRIDFPGCIVNIWASLECTNYSKAKGGLPRDADSRTLAHALFMYLEHLKPDYLYIENVREFMSWGPLDEKGRPISKMNGRDYIRWIKNVCSYGYRYDWKMLNSADFGAYTSRERYFGIFAKGSLPIKWPESTHSKKPSEGGLFESQKKWMSVRDVLDLHDEGKSIFSERKKPISENTLKRIYAGLVKFVAGGEDIFIQKYFSGKPNGKVISVNGPAGTITTIDGQAIVKSCFIQQRNTGNPNSKVISTNAPARTITSTGGNQELVPCFLSHYYGNGFNTSISEPCPTLRTKDSVLKIDPSFLIDYQYTSNPHSLDSPCPTLLTKDKFAKTDVKFIHNYYSGGGQLSDINNPNPTLTGIPKQRVTSVLFMDQQYGMSKPSGLDQPAGTITKNPKLNLVQAQSWIMDTSFGNVGNDLGKPLGVITANRKWHYLMNPSWGGFSSGIEQPSPVIIARQDKAPMYKISANQGKIFAIPIFPQENETWQKIRIFMALYGIIDIKMRMLKIKELLKIQGFPEEYKLKGTKTDQKKFIGNAVVPLVAKKLAITNYEAIQCHFKKAA
ncbi:MAG: DNA cytosine methyltransferase [Mangrovibacterium sp.]